MRVTLTNIAIMILATAALVATGPGVSAMTLIGPHTVNVRCDPAALASAISNSVNGEVLSLKPSCIYHLTGPLPTLETAIAIVGNSATIEASPAPGAPGFTMLDVDVQAQLAVSHLNFRNADAGASGTGGAVEDDGTLTVTGGTFTGNTTTGFGGAIDNYGTLTVTGATFLNNQSADGGAIENMGAAVITNSIFRGNQASFNGGAIHSEGQLTITNSWFSGNSAAVNGGGLFNGIFGNAAAITGSTFHQNQAFDGAGIYNEDVVSLGNSVVSANASSDQGGGVSSDWELDVGGSLIVSNTAANGGGGIYDGNFFGPPGTVILSGSPVVGNLPDNCEPLGTIPNCPGPAFPGHHAPSAPRPVPAHAGPRALARDFYPHPGH